MVFLILRKIVLISISSETRYTTRIGRDLIEQRSDEPWRPIA